MKTLLAPALAENTAIAYVYGATLPQLGQGGCAYRIELPDGAVKERTFFEEAGTIPKMTLYAVIDSIMARGADGALIIRTSSDYVYEGCKTRLEEWKALGWERTGGALAHRRLWRIVDFLLTKGNVTIELVKDSPKGGGLNRVKQLAQRAAKEGDCL